jgi:hypothetical protein
MLPNLVIQALQEAGLIQKHDRLCDLAAIDAIPIELLPILTLNNQISIAKQSTTAEKILINLATSTHKEVRLAILKNSNITAAPLTILSEDKDVHIRRLVQFHRQTPGEILLKFRCYFRIGGSHLSRIYEEAASRRLTSPKLLEELAQHQIWGVQHEVARNQASPINVLESIAKGYSNDSRYSCYSIEIVAENPSTPVEILQEPSFYKTNSYFVARNPSTPIETLEELSKIDLRGDLYRSMADNPSTPSHILEKIAISCPKKEISTLQLIAQHPNTPFLTTSFLLENKCVVSQDSLIYIYMNLLRKNELKSDLAVEIQAMIASHVNIPIDILKELTREHTSTPIDILERLSHSKDRALNKAAQDCLRSIYRELAAKPETSTEQLWKILYHGDIEIRLAVLQHPQGLSLLLDRALQIENSLNRFIAALHPQLSAAQRDRLLYSDRWIDRLAIACNPSVSIEYLQRLIQDSHDLVRDIASQKITD